MISKKINLVAVFVFAIIFNVVAQDASSIVGKWKTVDEETNEAKSIVEIYESHGTYFGKITEIINPADRDNTCIYCKGDEKGLPLIGLSIIKDLKEEDNKYTDGTIFDPEKGKKYNAKLWVDENDSNLLNVRGYIGFLHRTQHWYRVE